jgi:zinc protease
MKNLGSSFTKINFILLFLAGLAEPGFAESKAITVPNSRFILQNGLNVILSEDHTTPTVSVNIWYHVGSGREKPGRSGFAHLFEHLMFEGSGNVPEGKFDEWLEEAGGKNNGSTNPDRTNYVIDIPRNALELVLFLESDRMAFLLNAMSSQKVDLQRDVVKNERRQNHEDQPYGLASIIINENLFPTVHPYHWPTIGYMEHLTAAKYQDVVDFFQKYYGPNNASLCITGDIDPVQTRSLVEKWFGDVPRGPAILPMNPAKVVLTEEKRIQTEDRVQLPRLYLAWHSPAYYAPGDAELDVLADILSGSKNSRLFRRLVYELQIAQDVYAMQSSKALGSTFSIIATAREGKSLSEIEKVIFEEIEKLKVNPPNMREVERAVNQIEAGFLSRLESVGGFGGKADQMNGYFFYTGNPDYFNEDLMRYKALGPQDIQSYANTILRNDGRVALSVVPQGKKELAAKNSKPISSGPKTNAVDKP